ncbi:MAG: CRISPR-associated helicase Cas3' [Chitinophagaceae bacterium]|nr:CRISPR-associated helicase Cas3' [Chitinophagaceae bacterium]
MVDVNALKSHPDKKLFDHVMGVITNVQKLTEGLSVYKLAEIAAVFHDLGKINPNFQKKINHNPTIDYSHHAYLSAYTFFVFCIDKNNRELIKSILNEDNIQNELISLIILIAKHHGHLPDFCPKSELEIEPYILSKDEIKSLYKFLKQEVQYLPVEEYTKGFKQYENLKVSQQLLTDDKVQQHFIDKLKFDARYTKSHLDFFLTTQFAFATLIQADKSDAMDVAIIDEDKAKVKSFCKIYPETLQQYISKFKADNTLNKIRTEIRKESVNNIQLLLTQGKRVFELTAPTGSGKTIMLLCLASEILKVKGSYRIMYALPFLSITEQVEKEVLDIFKDFQQDNFIQRIDSKSNSKQFDEIQQQLDSNPMPEKMEELDFLAFREQVFAYPFVITTFVRFFETLLSNHNATLLKLPNFSKSIFLLDEIQSLPPRLYTFFVAYLTKFCEKFDCYAIISTATQPNLVLPNEDRIKSFFVDYEKPVSLLEHKKYFESDVFNRYRIEYQREGINIEKLADKVIAEDNSVLVIVNTIDDSKDLFKQLEQRFSKNELYLLNTHFIPNDRKEKIRIIKERLNQNKKTILISTQLIEAGVDIDFPVLYRDFALVSSIVQSAGRCNRNGKLNGLGRVVLFNLCKEGKLRANLIYGRGKDKDILTFTNEALGHENSFEEKNLFNIQKVFFDKIAANLHFAKHKQNKFNIEFDFLEDIKECSFGKIGKFQLIDEQDFGEQHQYYVPLDDKDSKFEILFELRSDATMLMNSPIKDWNAIKSLNFKIQNLLKKMSNQIVSVRLRDREQLPILAHAANYNGIYKIGLDFYSFEKGLNVSAECLI